MLFSHFPVKYKKLVEADMEAELIQSKGIDNININFEPFKFGSCYAGLNRYQQNIG